MIFATLLVLATLYAYGLYLASKGINLGQELSKKTGIVADTTWVVETIDIVKDWIYLYMFKHVWWAFLTLVISIVLPISVMCSMFEGN